VQEIFEFVQFYARFWNLGHISAEIVPMFRTIRSMIPSQGYAALHNASESLT